MFIRFLCYRFKESSLRSLGLKKLRLEGKTKGNSTCSVVGLDTRYKSWVGEKGYSQISNIIRDFLVLILSNLVRVPRCTQQKTKE